MDKLFSHIKFRYTFASCFQSIGSLNEDDMKGIALIAGLMVEKLDAVWVSVGIEDLDKFGESTHMHVHIHAVSPKKVDAIRKAMVKFMKEELNEERKGNSLYSCTEVKDILDQNRLLRYPFKQGRRGNGDVDWLKHLNVLPPDYNYEVERECAIEEWERLVIVNRQKRERSLNPNTFEKFEDYMTKQDAVKTTAAVAGHIHDFYLKEKMSMNLKTMGGYVRTYSVQQGIISRSENVSKILENM